IIFDFLFKLLLGHHRIERWLGIGTFFWPEPMTPVDFLDGSLIGHAFFERQCSLRNTRLRFGTEETQQSPGDNRRCDCAKKQNDQSAQIEKAWLSVFFCVHCGAVYLRWPRFVLKLFPVRVARLLFGFVTPALSALRPAL